MLGLGELRVDARGLRQAWNAAALAAGTVYWPRKVSAKRRDRGCRVCPNHRTSFSAKERGHFAISAIQAAGVFWIARQSLKGCQEMICRNPLLSLHGSPERRNHESLQIRAVRGPSRHSSRP